MLRENISPIFELKMLLLENEGVGVMDKFNEENFNIRRFKLEMGWFP